MGQQDQVLNSTIFNLDMCFFLKKRHCKVEQVQYFRDERGVNSSKVLP